MIVVPVDEAHAFDMYSIMLAKKNVGLMEIDDDVAEFERYMIDQLGRIKFDKVFRSEEYRALQSINTQLFSILENLRSGAASISAIELDELNQDRFQAKKRLQRVHFGDNLTEKKTNQ